MSCDVLGAIGRHATFPYVDTLNYIESSLNIFITCFYDTLLNRKIWIRPAAYNNNGCAPFGYVDLILSVFNTLNYKCEKARQHVLTTVIHKNWIPKIISKIETRIHRWQQTFLCYPLALKHKFKDTSNIWHKNLYTIQGACGKYLQYLFMSNPISIITNKVKFNSLHI